MYTHRISYSLRYIGRIIAIAVICLCPHAIALGQSENIEIENESKETNAIEQIAESSNGKIEILIDQDIIEKILTPPTAHKRASSPNHSGLKPGLNKIPGYRIQVFSDGRNQHSLESRAKARGNAISAKFPKYRGQVYTFSSAPNWYTRVGNFQTASEANEALSELRRSFPSFADEMRVVKCQIIVLR